MAGWCVNWKRKHEYTPGETLLNNESRYYCLVKVVNNASDSEWIRYSLEIVEILKDQLFPTNPLGVGMIFNVSERLGSPYAGWHLRDPQSGLKLIARLRMEREQAGPLGQ